MDSDPTIVTLMEAPVYSPLLGPWGLSAIITEADRDDCVIDNNSDLDREVELEVNTVTAGSTVTSDDGIAVPLA